MEALTRQDLKPPVPREGALIFYEKEGFDAALARANELRNKGVPAELMPVPENKSGYHVYEKGWHSSVFLIHRDGSCERLDG